MHKILMTFIFIELLSKCFACAFKKLEKDFYIVCMYVCIYVCVYVCMYVCIYVCKCVCMCTCIYVCSQKDRQCHQSVSGLMLTHALALVMQQGLFQKMKAASSRDIKGYFFPKKTIKEYLSFELTLCSQHIYTAFNKSNS